MDLPHTDCLPRTIERPSYRRFSFKSTRTCESRQGSVLRLHERNMFSFPSRRHPSISLYLWFDCVYPVCLNSKSALNHDVLIGMQAIAQSEPTICKPSKKAAALSTRAENTMAAPVEAVAANEDNDDDDSASTVKETPRRGRHHSLPMPSILRPFVGGPPPARSSAVALSY